MKKIALAFVAAATFAVVPAFAQDDASGGASATTTTTTAAAPAAAAGGEKEFGNPGVINFGAATGLDFKSESVKPPGGGDSQSTTHFQLDADVSYFVAEGISVGGDVLFAYDKPPNSDAGNTIGIGPVVGYNLWLTPGQLSLWPQLDFLYITSKPAVASGAPSPDSTNIMRLGVWVPLLIHPVKHFHFGVGPYFDTDLSAKSGGNDAAKTTAFGLKLEIAGWL